MNDFDYTYHDKSWWYIWKNRMPKEKQEAGGCWAKNAEQVDAEYLGEAKEGTEAGVICASFHAG